MTDYDDPRDDRPLHELVPDDWRELDDTIADGPAPAAVPDEARPWLSHQRLMHGLLRALHTQDAAAREGRIEQIFGRIDAEAATAGRRHGLLVAIAATLLAALGVWFMLPQSLPTAEAAVGRIVGEMARDIDRRFRVEVCRAGADGQQLARHEFRLVTRPGMRFLVEGQIALGGANVGEIHIGCDGEELWLRPRKGRFRQVVPLARKEQLMKMLGDVLDLGYLDVHDLVRRLPEDFELRVVDRVRGDDGQDLLAVEASRRRKASKGPRRRLRSAHLLYEEQTGMIRQIEVETIRASGNTHSFLLEYLGEGAGGDVDYSKPW